MWLLRVDLLRVAVLLICRWERRPSFAEVVKWICHLGMRWLGDDCFIGDEHSTVALDDDQILESLRLPES